MPDAIGAFLASFLAKSMIRTATEIEAAGEIIWRLDAAPDAQWRSSRA